MINLDQLQTIEAVERTRPSVKSGSRLERKKEGKGRSNSKKDYTIIYSEVNEIDIDEIALIHSPKGRDRKGEERWDNRGQAKHNSSPSDIYLPIESK